MRQFALFSLAVILSSSLWAGCSSSSALDVTVITSPVLDQAPFAGVDRVELRWRRPGVDPVIQHGSWPAGTTELTLHPPPLVDNTVLELAAVSNGVVVAIGRTPPLASDANATSVYVGLVNQFSSTATPRPLASARFGASATMLGDGRVLIAGGATRGAPGVPDPSSISAMVDLYDPTSGTFAAFTGAADFAERIYHAAGATPDGGVLFAGGLGKFGPLDDIYAIGPTRSASIGKLPSPRWAAASTSLDDGSLLVVGGYTDSDGMGGGTLATDAVIVDPSGSVSTVALPAPRAFAVATRLSDGNVLVTGGRDTTGVLDSGLVFDAGAKSFSMLSPSGDARLAMQVPRVSHTATLLPSGAVFLFGGNDGRESVGNTELWTPDSGGFVDTHVFNLQPRERATATALGDGTVVLAGGETSPQPLATPSPVLDPIVYRPAPGMTTGVLDDDLTDASARAEATSTALIDGSVLYLGGGVSNPRTLAGGAEIFVPCFGPCLDLTP